MTRYRAVQLPEGAAKADDLFLFASQFFGPSAMRGRTSSGSAVVIMLPMLESWPDSFPHSTSSLGSPHRSITVGFDEGGDAVSVVTPSADPFTEAVVDGFAAEVARRWNGVIQYGVSRGDGLRFRNEPTRADRSLALEEAMTSVARFGGVPSHRVLGYLRNQREWASSTRSDLVWKHVNDDATREPVRVPFDPSETLSGNERLPATPLSVVAEIARRDGVKLVDLIAKIYERDTSPGVGEAVKS